ncbi:MAG TPA: hypothetical protein VFA20_11465 [Myxococcaceae bacterium]|nr:hypothetical protein [Myxococcaceae bacterium]
MNPMYPRAVPGPKRRKHGQRTLDLPSQLVVELKSEAARLGRSLSSVVQMAWRISRGLPPDPPQVVQPWEAIASELEDRLNYPSKRSSAARAWLHFEAWCVEHQLLPCPARDETLLGYARACLAIGVGRKDVLRAAAAVAVVHRVRGHKPPRLRPSAAAAVDVLLREKERAATAR